MNNFIKSLIDFFQSAWQLTEFYEKNTMRRITKKALENVETMDTESQLKLINKWSKVNQNHNRGKYLSLHKILPKHTPEQIADRTLNNMNVFFTGVPMSNYINTKLKNKE